MGFPRQPKPRPHPCPVLRTPSGSHVGLSGLRRLETWQSRDWEKIFSCLHCSWAAGVHPRARCWGGSCGQGHCGPGTLPPLLACCQPVRGAGGVTGLGCPQSREDEAHNLPPQEAPSSSMGTVCGCPPGNSAQGISVTHWNLVFVP